MIGASGIPTDLDGELPLPLHVVLDGLLPLPLRLPHEDVLLVLCGPLLVDVAHLQLLLQVLELVARLQPTPSPQTSRQQRTQATSGI